MLPSLSHYPFPQNPTPPTAPPGLPASLHSSPSNPQPPPSIPHHPAPSQAPPLSPSPAAAAPPLPHPSGPLPSEAMPPSMRSRICCGVTAGGLPRPPPAASALGAAILVPQRSTAQGPGGGTAAAHVRSAGFRSPFCALSPSSALHWLSLPHTRTNRSLGSLSASPPPNKPTSDWQHLGKPLSDWLAKGAAPPLLFPPLSNKPASDWQNPQKSIADWSTGMAALWGGGGDFP